MEEGEAGMDGGSRTYAAQSTLSRGSSGELAKATPPLSREASGELTKGGPGRSTSSSLSRGSSGELAKDALRRSAMDASRLKEAEQIGCRNADEQSQLYWVSAIRLRRMRDYLCHIRPV